ncbi:hypothetical protein E5F05_00575 (plasmid) [Deinococcus metallilatus]|uniref:Uncharacterized protein n=1 Tax=Deinococcus metallilatus TaxID=1211322 RepID=A0AAJ5F9S8_9DEIO|nr:hypothetical protein [Deinococcus metallilatus]MBB5293397.1 hypothetical protein [Deinococcus metallilatus]QBY06492.1 hypothetical protein E5F05_00575 [Deinococcus metallilatus]RXJ17835.1 hypothetical protein ERJ73_00185 [Deinococcus metallilatus]TLK32107.1 hypothetical protein FCS05_01205 [Deinococcus metallilatus]GMA15383.1 hypothetical protein GCM10025871_17140 [Deinococcus metallilatus]
MNPRATLTVSPGVYRRHLVRPEVLLTLLARSAEVITDEQVDWEIHEGQSPFLVSDIDYELYHPAQRPLGGIIDWQLSGCATAALLALRLIAMREEAQMAGERG